MRKPTCTRESELLEALEGSRWPQASDASLVEHVGGCASCTDLLAVVAPLLDDQRLLIQEAVVPSSAIVWWRAQMRSRREAAQMAARPISFVQGIALACAAGLLATALGIFVPTFRRSLAWMFETVQSWPGLQLTVPEDPLASLIVVAVIAAIGLSALILPVALYFTFRED